MNNLCDFILSWFLNFLVFFVLIAKIEKTNDIQYVHRCRERGVGKPFAIGGSAKRCSHDGNQCGGS